MLPLLQNDQGVFKAQNIKDDIRDLTKGINRDKIFILTDEGSKQHCLNIIDADKLTIPQNIITIPQGDINKNIKTAQSVWQHLSDNGADRHSLLINLGGGMPCDLGGFCAASFKRGIKFINIPTTLLAQVDASIGGKTGINLGGLKNEIGFFANPAAVLVDNCFFKTLDTPNLLSGYAELLKHALIHSNQTYQTLKKFDINNPDFQQLGELVIESIRIKDYFVVNDPTEKNIRKALNFGHTIGHAIETYSMQKGKPMLHGYAVAYGMIAELYLSHKQLGFPMAKIEDFAKYIKGLYGHITITENDINPLIELMRHDKKNEANKINFTLLKDIGDIEINCHATEEEIIDSLIFYNQTTSK
jgi:3-dehydroquinate synthase